MDWLLDTNIAIHLRDGDARIEERVAGLDGVLLLSVVSRAELEGGVYQLPAEIVSRRHRLDLLLSAVRVLDFDQASADAYRTMIESVGFSRRKVLDRMIAAQALANNATLVTRNVADFRDIPGLLFLEW
ncbi:MAG: PIN domain-containing protein [Brevundimonas sp.]